MGISSRGLRALSWPFVIGFVVVWNALNLLAMWLNGGWRRYEDPSALLVLAITCLSTSFLSLGIVFVPGVRDLVTAAKRRHLFEASPYLFISGVAGFIGGAMLIEALVRGF